ncbi:MAG TPA: FAD-binding oxidoreductase [Steroidobacteraceae bacterium]|nr:FAD-binding oxidoreductase [Steroidobacteraceae bacterium]
MEQQQLANLARRELLAGGAWLAGAVLLGASGEVLAKLVPSDGRLSGFGGDTVWRDQDGYEAARRNAVWVQNLPARYPALIAYPKSTADVCAAVRFAARHGIKVAPRSGGHSWAATHLQSGSLLLDLSAWNDIVVDAEQKTAWVQPAARSGAVTAALQPHQLAFPTGHNADVTLGGFLLCGGYGRNGRQWDVGCRNILEIECVNARGELIRANEHENPDFYWAARGGGAGFFGVLTRLKLRVFDLPSVIRQRVYVYDMADFDAIMRWSMQVMPQLPDFVETMVFRRRLDEKTGGWGEDNLLVVAVSMADSVAEVERGFAPLETCPARSRAKDTFFNDHASLEQFFARNEGSDPKGWRFSVDGMWSDADPAELVPALRQLYETLPSPRSFVYYGMWGPTKKGWPDMAMSLQANVYIAAHAIWDSEADDAKMHAWTSGSMRELERFSVGSKLNDDATVRRPSKYFSDAAAAKLRRLTARHDPHGVFRSFLKVGEPV